MKRPAWLIVATFFFVTVSAQVQVRPLPEPGYDQRIRDFVNQVKVVDTHEWLETVQASKIMAFGGDFLYVEDIYSSDDIS